MNECPGRMNQAVGLSYSKVIEVFVSCASERGRNACLVSMLVNAPGDVVPGTVTAATHYIGT